jgi:hypothetical protein
MTGTSERRDYISNALKAKNNNTKVIPEHPKYHPCIKHIRAIGTAQIDTYIFSAILDSKGPWK